MMTMMGEMAKDMQDDDVESPLKVKLSKLADSISKFGYIGAVVIAITLMIHKVIDTPYISSAKAEKSNYKIYFIRSCITSVCKKVFFKLNLF